MELKGELCTVRTWRTADAASLVRHANNENVARHLRDRFPYPYSTSDARRFIEAVSQSHPATNFAIDLGGEAAGGIGFSPGSDVERYSAEIGYWLGEAFWGRGITAEALRLTSRYAFDICRMLRLFALPFADNARSIRVLEKAGYVREGVMRCSSVKHGSPRDQALYALVNQRWTYKG
ncbi:MAG TPA: GNAT family protein [Vicinamibacterales bacterium]|nr:GNAT family protein [Vicinamibacterales bacterium]